MESSSAANLEKSFDENLPDLSSLQDGEKDANVGTTLEIVSTEATGTKRKLNEDEFSQEDYIDISNLTEQEKQRLIDSRILQVLELSDFEDDNDLYNEALSDYVNEEAEDIYKPRPIMPILNGMKALPKMKFMTVKELVEIILDPTYKPLYKIPVGRKENVYCVLNNVGQPFTPSNKCLCMDDLGYWEITSHASQHHIVFENGDFKLIVRQQGQFAIRTRPQYKILNPQPDENNLMSVTRMYQRLDKDPTHIRKVTRFTAIPKNFSTAMGHCEFYDIYEYARKQ